MRSCAQYILECKAALGDKRMADAKLGDHLGGIAQQTISDAKAGRMSNKVALAVGELLVKHGVIEHAGEVMLVALAQRSSGRVRTTMLDYAKKVLAPVLRAIAVVATVLGLAMPHHDVQPVGGEGRF